MPLSKPWKPLTRETIASVPDRPGVYELGDDDGVVVSVAAGPLQDELKSVLAYGDGEQVRWQTTSSLDHANRLAEKHRSRL